VIFFVIYRAKPWRFAHLGPPVHPERVAWNAEMLQV